MKTKHIKLGDAVAKLTKILHIPHCPKCEKRRLILNEIQRVGIKETMRRLKALEKPKAHETWSLEKIMRKLDDCCNDK